MISCVSKLAHFHFLFKIFFISENVFNKKPDPEIIPNDIGFKVIPPTIVPMTIREVEAVLINKLTCLKCL